MKSEIAGITRANEGIQGISWNILGQTYVPKSRTEHSFSWHATFPPGTFVPPHIHPDQDEYLYILEGRLDFFLDGAEEYATAGDTDGVDGAEEIAGAMVTPDTLERAWAQGINPRASLDNNDGHGFFQALGNSVVTGPTLTNVNDFRAIVIDTPSPPQPLNEPAP